MVNSLCPILGDHTYSHQVQTILGKPILMDPHQALGTQNIQVCNLYSMDIAVAQAPATFALAVNFLHKAHS